MAKAAGQTVWDELDTVQVASNINRLLGSLEQMLARQVDPQQYRPFSPSAKDGRFVPHNDRKSEGQGNKSSAIRNSSRLSWQNLSCADC